MPHLTDEQREHVLELITAFGAAMYMAGYKAGAEIPSCPHDDLGEIGRLGREIRVLLGAEPRGMIVQKGSFDA